jgi:hypothetical protein
MSIDRGAVRVSIGSIGLVNPKGVKISTQKAFVSSANAILNFEIRPDADTVSVEWLPTGGTVSVYNVRSKELTAIRSSGVSFDVGVAAAPETPDDIPDETPDDSF